MKKYEFHVITTGQQTIKEIVSVAKDIEPFIDALHIREKEKTAAEIYQLIFLLIESGIPQDKIYVNDRADVALVHDVKGAQLPYHSLPALVVKEKFPHLRVGCSVHNVAEAEEAHQSGADFVIYGHIFNTNSKKDLTPRGLSDIKKIKAASQVTTIAIGGIHPTNVKDVLKAGADGIAVMSGVFESEHPRQAVRQYANLLKAGCVDG